MSDWRFVDPYHELGPWIALWRPIPGAKALEYIVNFGHLGPAYHYEPLRRFIETPPNPEWQVLGIADDAPGAWKLIEDDTLVRYADVLGPQALNVFKRRQQVDRKTRFRIMKRDNFKCRLCGRTAEDGVKLEVDHIHPVARGGTNHKDNLWTLCFDCNRAKRDKPLEEA